MNRPKASQNDPHFIEREDAKHFAHTIERDEIFRITDILAAIAVARPSLDKDEGPTVKARIRQGYSTCRGDAKNIIIEQYIKKGAIWENLTKQYSYWGAQQACERRLWNLRRAYELGICEYGVGIHEWNPEK